MFLTVCLPCLAPLQAIEFFADDVELFLAGKHRKKTLSDLLRPVCLPSSLSGPGAFGGPGWLDLKAYWLGFLFTASAWAMLPGWAGWAGCWSDLAK